MNGPSGDGSDDDVASSPRERCSSDGSGSSLIYDSSDGSGSNDWDRESTVPEIVHLNASRVVGASWITVKQCASFTDAKQYMSDISTFRYKHQRNFKSGAARKVYVYICVSHLGCPHKFRVVLEHHRAELQECSSLHAADLPEQTVSGIHPMLRAKVDGYLKCGFTPKKLEVELRLLYQNDIHMLKLLPTRAQIKERRKVVARSKSGGWEVRNLADLAEWGQARRCDDAATFFEREETRSYDSFLEQDEEYRRRLLVLDLFEGSYIDSGEHKPYMGLVLTSRQNMWNMSLAHDAQGESLAISTDGTYKLHFGGWTLIDLGAVYTKTSRGGVRHKFLPWTYLFVRSECEEAYYKLFDVTTTAYLTFFNRVLVPAIATIDHTSYIMDALELKWPGVHVISCYIHLKRNVRRHKALLVRSDNYEKVKADIELMWLARSLAQFRVVAASFTALWASKLGELVFAEWFSKVYLTPPWDLWFASASDCPGVVAHQQHIESHHKGIKTVCAHELRALTSVVLEHTLPRVLVSDSLTCEACPGLWDAGPLATEVLEKALMLQRSINHLVDSTGSNVLFNSTTHLGRKITRNRAERFLISIQEEEGARVTEKVVKDILLSLHVVRIDDAVDVRDDMTSLRPFNVAECGAIRQKYRCDCAGYFSSGWLCSHIVACLAIFDGLNAAARVRTLPQRKSTGRPRAIGGGLSIETRENFFLPQNHLKIVKKRPLSIVGYKCSKEFKICEVNEAGTKTWSTHTVVGAIRAYLPSKRRWSASFPVNGEVETVRFDGNKVVQAIYAAFAGGVDVTGEVAMDL